MELCENSPHRDIERPENWPVAVNNLQFKVGAGQLEATIVFCCVGCPLPVCQVLFISSGTVFYTLIAYYFSSTEK
jgi:hypothetical protein